MFSFDFDRGHLFSSSEARELLGRVRARLDSLSIPDGSGIIVGLSGGADSVFLLLALVALSPERGYSVRACHINHMIRGKEADRDEEFSRLLSEYLSIPFSSHRVNIPEIKKAKGGGTEEIARRERYRIFEDLLAEHSDCSFVATAHNSTDNLETIIFNLSRGAGSVGISGITPKRGAIIRPVIDISSEEIRAFLGANSIPFVTDSTNSSAEYTRNYIRAEIIPRIRHLNPNPELAGLKLSHNLREDSDYIERAAEFFLAKENGEDGIKRAALAPLHGAVLSRVLIKLSRACGAAIERNHIEKIKELLLGGDFEYSIPGARFVCEGGLCRITNEAYEERAIPTTFFNEGGIAIIPDLGIALSISDDKFEHFYPNVYKISIQVDISSAIIKGSLRVRSRREGDAYFYGGMTHKVKKLFCDKKIPKSMRSQIPIVCDDDGIVWIPGFGVRFDSAQKQKKKWLTLYKKINFEE